MNNPENWKRMSFKRNKVWAQTDDLGNLQVQNGKVLIKYNLDQDYEYRVKPESLAPEDQALPAKPKIDKKAQAKVKKLKPTKLDPNENYIKIYTDGASSGNPGPAGIGVLLIFGDKTKQISQYIGKATNNIAELTAIKTALEQLKRTDLPVRIFSDSSYCIGLLTLGWKPKKNQELVAQIKMQMERFKDIGFIKVKGHAGIEENEIADRLATSAIEKGRGG